MHILCFMLHTHWSIGLYSQLQQCVARCLEGCWLSRSLMYGLPVEVVLTNSISMYLGCCHQA